MLDLQGYNYSEWRYDQDHAAHPNWKIFGSETSSAVRSRGIYHTPASKSILTSSDNQCSSYDNSVVSWGSSAESSYNNDVSRSFIAGQFIWTGFDYIGEPTPYPWPAKSSYFGIVDTAGFPKDIYYFYQSRWTTTPMVHILPHWNWSAGTTVTVFVYTNCDSAELFLNGVSQGSKTFTAGAVHLEWNVPWASGTLRVEGTRGGAVVVSEEVKTAGAAAKVALSVDRSTISADGKDLAFVTADIQDATGIVVPTAANAVSFLRVGARRDRGCRQRQRHRYLVLQGHHPERVQRQGIGHRAVDRRSRPDRGFRQFVRVDVRVGFAHRAVNEVRLSGTG